VGDADDDDRGRHSIGHINEGLVQLAGEFEGGRSIPKFGGERPGKKTERQDRRQPGSDKTI